MSNWKPILAAMVIFAAGFVTGGLILGAHSSRSADAGPIPGEGPPGRKPERSKDRHLRDLCGRLQDELRLTPVQRERIEEIVRLAHERVKAVADRMGPLMHAEFKQMEQEILKELTPDQAEKFEAIIRERESKFSRGNPPPPGPTPDQGPLEEGGRPPVFPPPPE
ncbi:MAG: hypothetical protein KJ072_08535 [Verrucomicrobia bacterium]|nr:hypothetical protein [Verrucomicrobiota bacterium]